MKFVESKDLKPGMRLAKPVYNKMGVLLYDRNSFLTMSGIKSIENFGLIGLFILEPAEPLPPITEEEIQFEQFQTIYMFRVKEIMTRLQTGENPENLRDLVSNIINRYGSLDHKLSFTQNLRSSADFVYKHAISTAILCAMMGHALGYSQLDKVRLVTAALLYDLGYLYVPRTILDKKDPYTDDDRAVISECRKKGYQLLYPEINKYLLDTEVLNILQQTITHLSTADAASLQEKAFSQSALALVVADRFDQLTAMNLNHSPISEIAAIRLLKKDSARYDRKCVSALARCIKILPCGCSVDLSNGDKGIVLIENQDNYMTPVVLNIRDNQIYDLSDPAVAKNMQIVDIMKTMDNRILIDQNTLKLFSSDDNLKLTLNRYRQKKMSMAKRLLHRS